MTELRTALRQFESIGADRCLTSTDVGAERSAFADRARSVYQAEFGCHTGGTNDAAFRRLDHPAHQTGRPTIDAGTPVLIVGTGPSLAAGAAGLRRLRRELAIVTSLRGARALCDLGIVPDLVLLTEASPLDATLTLVNGRAAHSIEQLSEVPLVAADERTPAEVIRGIASDWLFIPSYCPSWTWWPAAAVAMVVEVGQARDLYEIRRASARSTWNPEALDIACDEARRWREVSWLRRALQEQLGLEFLPTFWRLDTFGRGARRSRALELALGELCDQCDRLEAKLETAQPAAEAA